MRPDPAAPCDLRELGYGEHLIVWSFRAIVSRRWDCDIIRREYDHACGDRAAEARSAVCAFASRVEDDGRRCVAIGAPGILGVTRDEQQLITLYAAAQRNDEFRFRAHLSWLLGRPSPVGFFELARTTAAALADRGHGLALRISPFAA